MAIGEFGFTALSLMLIQPSEVNLGKYLDLANNPADAHCFTELSWEIRCIQDLFDKIEFAYYMVGTDGEMIPSRKHNQCAVFRETLEKCIVDGNENRFNKTAERLSKIETPDFLYDTEEGLANGTLIKKVSESQNKLGVVLSTNAVNVLQELYSRRDYLDTLMEKLSSFSSELNKEVDKVFGVNIYRLVNHKPNNIYYKVIDMYHDLTEDVAHEEIARNIKMIRDNIKYRVDQEEDLDEIGTVTELLAERYGENKLPDFVNSKSYQVIQSKDVSPDTKKLLHLFYTNIYHICKSEKVLNGIFGLGLSLGEYLDAFKELDEGCSIAGLHSKLDLYYTRQIGQRLLVPHERVFFPALHTNEEGNEVAGYAQVTSNVQRLLDSDAVEIGEKFK